MKINLKIIFLLFLILPKFVSANFINMNWGARALALGNAYTALADEPTAIFWNPAGLSNVKDLSFTAAHQNLYGISDLYNEMGAITIPFSYFRFGVGFTQLNLLDVYREEVLYISASSILWLEKIPIRLGFNLKHLSAISEYSSTDSYHKIDFDLGVQSDLTKSFTVAGVVRNISQPTFNFVQESDNINREYVIGYRIMLLNSVNIVNDFIWNSAGSTYNIGGEMWFYDVFAPRIGMNGDSFTAGFGFKSKLWQLDGAILANDNLGSTYRISFGMKFNNLFK